MQVTIVLPLEQALLLLQWAGDVFHNTPDTTPSLEITAEAYYAVADAILSAQRGEGGR
jgi:hypothetical protein